MKKKNKSLEKNRHGIPIFHEHDDLYEAFGIDSVSDEEQKRHFPSKHIKESLDKPSFKKENRKLQPQIKKTNPPKKKNKHGFPILSDDDDLYCLL
ncbi:hypothetical protein QUF76_16080, partial [Desulfobacterales bacterium HSG16]|nr:hypothetical protein [Desulfobacterales bacterium HSG16]